MTGLIIRVELQIGTKPSELDLSDAGLSTDNLVAPTDAKAKKPRSAPIAGTKALDIFWDKRIRDAGKMVRPSPLLPERAAGGLAKHSSTGRRRAI